MKLSDCFKDELLFIKDETLREVITKTLDSSPEYIAVIPASSTGKYHPKYALGEGGLVRHIKACIKIANCLIESGIVKRIYESDVKHRDISDDELSDIIISALLIHDCMKADDTDEHKTLFNHPISSAVSFVQAISKEGVIFDDECSDIFICVASHMGKWNTCNYSDVVLPVPVGSLQNIVHLCDLLASRRWLEVDFDL